MNITSAGYIASVIETSTLDVSSETISFETVYSGTETSNLMFIQGRFLQKQRLIVLIMIQ